MGPGGAPYVTEADLQIYMPAPLYGSFTTEQRERACLDASAIADSFISGRYQLPLLEWSTDLRLYTTYVACYLLLGMRGFNSQAGSDQLILQRYYDAVGTPGQIGTGWFVGVQRQTIHPSVTPTLAQPGDTTHDIPQVRSQPPRGWPRIVGGRSVV